MSKSKLSRPAPRASDGRRLLLAGAGAAVLGMRALSDAARATREATATLRSSANDTAGGARGLALETISKGRDRLLVGAADLVDSARKRARPALQRARIELESYFGPVLDALDVQRARRLRVRGGGLRGARITNAKVAENQARRAKHKRALKSPTGAAPG